MKILFYSILLFLGTQGCSNTPAPSNEPKTPDSILNDTSGIALGNSPDGAYRLFKTQLTTGGTALKVLRLKDLYQALVATTQGDPKFYWSSDSKYLIANYDMPDSTEKHRVVLFHLPNFQYEASKYGQLIGFDQVNNEVFMYRYTVERQQIVYFNLGLYGEEITREILTPPGEKVPSAVIQPSKRMARIKAYMNDGVPVNIGFNY